MQSIVTRLRAVRTVLFALALLLGIPVKATVKSAIQKAMPAVVEVHVAGDNGETVKTGSGFVISRQGLVVTNYHVVENAAQAKVVLSNGETLPVLGVQHADPAKDFAVLRISASNLSIAELGNSDLTEVGDDLIAIGAPYGLAKSVTTGILSQVRTISGIRLIQHTAAISPGSSGGPLLNTSGQVVGINTFLLKDGQSLYFALPINYIKSALRSGSQVVTAFEGRKSVGRAQESDSDAHVKELIERSFYPYIDPNGLYGLLLPRVWRTDRSVTRDRSGNTVVLFTASAPDATDLSAAERFTSGVRVRIIIPPDGTRWSEENQVAWAKQVAADAAKSYVKLVTSEVIGTKWGGQDAVGIFMAGDTQTVIRIATVEPGHIAVGEGVDRSRSHHAGTGSGCLYRPGQSLRGHFPDRLTMQYAHEPVLLRLAAHPCLSGAGAECRRY